jgi:hypothetical protein
VGAGAALTAAALAVVASSGIPDLARASAVQLRHSYTAQVPGPTCDTGGAVWSVAPGEPISTRCGHDGLLMVVAPHAAGDVTFQPPDGFTSPNYRVSVTVTFGTALDGCASIYTRASAVGRYESDLCRHDAAGIFAVNTQHAARLAAGFARPALSYTVMAVADGTDQSLVVNGTRMATVVNKAFPETDYVALALLNLGGNAGLATFSHFVLPRCPSRRGPDLAPGTISFAWGKPVRP